MRLYSSSSAAAAATTKNVRIIVLPSHSCGGTLQSLYLKLLHSSTQTSADGLNGQHFTCSDWRKWSDLVSLRNVKSEEQAPVFGARLFHAHAAATGKAWSPRVVRDFDGTCSVVVSAEWRQRRAMISDVGRRLSDKYAGAVPCNQPLW